MQQADLERQNSQAQVVHAQDNSHACSIAIPLSSAALQILVPLATSIVAPSGQISSLGKNVIFGISFYSISSIPLPAISDFILLFILLST